ncbi:MAG: hypothetical protein KAH95_01465 [Spirochaetales bacterium]|nr:hypothetical protein [Spirochaetales bacterium]
MEHYLISIIPSEDITIKIRRLRTQLFKKFGTVSSRCLPEMIPVAFINEVIDKKIFQGLTISNEIKSLNYISTETNDIFLQITNTDFLDSITKRMKNYQTSGFITLEQGFYLGSEENNSDISNVITYLNQKKENILTWEKNNLELIKIKTRDDIWWNHIQWETIWSQKISLS